MDILINTEILISTLQNVISVIDKSYSKPILSNFMIKTLENEGGQGMVEFSATDYDSRSLSAYQLRSQLPEAFASMQKGFLI